MVLGRDTVLKFARTSPLPPMASPLIEDRLVSEADTAAGPQAETAVEDLLRRATDEVIDPW